MDHCPATGILAGYGDRWEARADVIVQPVVERRLADPDRHFGAVEQPRQFDTQRMVRLAGRIVGDLAQEQRLIAAVALTAQILRGTHHALLEIGLADIGRDGQVGGGWWRTQRLPGLLHRQHAVE